MDEHGAANTDDTGSTDGGATTNGTGSTGSTDGGATAEGGMRRQPTAERLPAEFLGRAFRVADAVAAGVPRRALRGRALDAPFHGIRVPGSAGPPPGAAGERETILARAHAYLPLMGAEQVFSHETAATALGLPLPRRLQRADAPLHVLSPHASRRRSGAGITGHHSTTAIRRHEVAGLPTVSPVTLWHQLAERLSVDELVMLGDALLRRTNPLSDAETLHGSLERLSRHRGIVALRTAAELIRPRTDSPRESECRLLLVRAGLPEPEVNGTILDDEGNFVAYGDMVYRDYKVLVEYDGGQHRDDEAQFHRDIDRLDMLMALGWRVLRFNRSHLLAGQVIVARTREALVQRGWRPQHP